MGDLRPDLERLGRRVEPDVDAFERLERRRRRKERNRRAAAGALALVVAAGGSLALYVALRNDDARIPGIAGGTGASVVPDVARVTCDGTTTALVTERVRPQADGVHILVTNTAVLPLALELRDLGGDNAPVGEHEVVWPIAPGVLELRCLDPVRSAIPSGGYAELDIVDPDGLFIPTELRCRGYERVGWFADYGEDAFGTGGPDPVTATLEQTDAIRETDEVGLAGYLEAETPQVRVVRDGEVVAVISLIPDRRGGWLLESGEACTGAGFG